MRIFLIVLTMLVGACGGSSGSQTPMDPPPPPPPPPPVNESPGGIWFGTRPNGSSVAMLISEDGAFRIIDEFGNQGFGLMTVANVNEFSVDYTFVPPINQTLIDGSEFATCTATGTLVERNSLDYTVTCLTALGAELGGNFPLNYDADYERASGLDVISGDYDDSGSVLTIDAAGALFEQNIQTGCVMNGFVRLIDPEWNLYEASFTSDNCVGDFAAMNGVEWDGVAALLTDFGDEFLVGAFTGTTATGTVSLAVLLPRI